MTKYLEIERPLTEYERAVRERFYDICDSDGVPFAVGRFLDAEIDSLLAWVEGETTPKFSYPSEDKVPPQFATGWNRAVECMNLAYRTLRGTNEPNV